MTEQNLEKLVEEKVQAALVASEPPKKFFLTENGRGVVDGGEMYNAVLNNMIVVMKRAMVDVLKEVK